MKCGVFAGLLLIQKAPFYRGLWGFWWFYAVSPIIFCRILSSCSQQMLGIVVSVRFSFSLLTKVVIKFPLSITYIWYTSLQVSSVMVLYQHVRAFMAGFLWVLGVGRWAFRVNPYALLLVGVNHRRQSTKLLG